MLERTYSYEDIDELQQMYNMMRKQIGMQTLMAIGAREYQYDWDQKGMNFKVAHGSARKYMNIYLMPDDTYTVQLWKRTKTDDLLLERASDVYAEVLSEVVYRMVNK